MQESAKHVLHLQNILQTVLQVMSEKHVLQSSVKHVLHSQVLHTSAENLYMIAKPVL